MSREFSKAQNERIERSVARYPSRTDFGIALAYQGAMAMEEAAEHKAMRVLDDRGRRRMSLIRKFVKNLNSEEWFRITGVARNPELVRKELIEERQGIS